MRFSLFSVRSGISRKVFATIVTTLFGIFLITGNVYAEHRNDNLNSFQNLAVKISGVVKNDAGETIIGATVLEVGTTNGTITDVDGKFALSVADAKSVIKVSFIGFEPFEVVVGETKNFDIVLQRKVSDIDEVVIIGYGVQKKVDVTSAVSSVKSESFNKGAVLDAGQLIQGKVAGLQISLPTGDPTSSNSVMLRGTSTLKGSTSPLILVDGVPGSFSTVAPEDIESVDVLKDGSATAIYGTRGTNGVIIITTKDAKGQANSIEYNGYVSVSQQVKKADFMEADDLRARWAEGWTFSGANDEDYGGDTKWLDEVSQMAVSNVHDLTFRGGSKGSSVLANVVYEDKEGTMKTSEYTNIRGRVQVSHSMFNDRLTANALIIANERNTGLGYNSAVYRFACIQNPTQPIYNEDGTYLERSVYNYDNPISYLNEREGMTRSRNIRFTGSFDFKITPDLILKGMYTRKGQSYLSGSYYNHKDVSTTEGGANGSASRYTSDYVSNMTELTVNWRKDFGLHKITAIAGYNYEDNTSENFYAYNKNFPTDSYSYNKLQTGTGLVDGVADMSSYKQSDKLIGLFARATYNYNDKYLLMLSLRHEGSSKFGADHKWGNFPGASAGWRLNNEDFMKGISWINNLKVRAGFGITGINISDPYVSLSSLDYDGSFLYNGEWISILGPVRNANPDLRWEKKYEYNFGVDFDLFDNRVGGSIDVYQRDTKDALWDYAVPVPPYQYGYITANVGQIRNRGVEVLVNAVPVKKKDFEWNTSITFSANQNELMSISNDQFQMSTDWFSAGHTGEPIQTTTHRVKVGEPIGNFFGLKSVGVNSAGKWVVERLKKDEDGNVTEVYYGTAENASEDDWQKLGNGVPLYNLSFNNQLRYKNFDLSVSMRGAFAFQILNYQKMYYGNPTIQYNVLNCAFDKHDVVGTTNGKKTGDQAYLNDAQRFVSEYIEDGDYLKIDNITLGYTFNTSKIDFIKSLRAYASCYNGFTFTGYTGLDPEVQITGLDPGTDSRDKYPTVMSVTVGLNITF